MLPSTFYRKLNAGDRKGACAERSAGGYSTAAGIAG
jgi:GH24 family phage-related lysozyme (muramidase)